MPSEAFLPFLLFTLLLIWVVFYKDVVCRFWVCPECKQKSIRHHKDQRLDATGWHQCHECKTHVLKHRGKVVTSTEYAKTRLIELEKLGTLTEKQQIEQAMLQMKVAQGN